MIWKAVATLGFLMVVTSACGGQAPTRPSATQGSTSVPVPLTATPTATPEGAVPEVPLKAPTPSPSPTPEQSDPGDGSGAPASVGIPPEPPERDLFELAQRLRRIPDGPVPRVVNPEPVSYQVGHKETFWVTDLVDVTSYTVHATLQVISEHAYWYVNDDLGLSFDDLNRAATVFEDTIHPMMTASFGEIWVPGVDNDPRLTILHTPLRGVDGYYGSSDEYPRQTHPHSNQREMIYMDGGRLTPGSSHYLGVLTHELQHAVHWNLDPGEDAWVNEGLSEVAKELAGYRASFVDSFLRRPATQLNYWPEDLANSPAHYGAATLFFSYLAQRHGGSEGLKDLVREPADGIGGVEAYLSTQGKTFTDVFKDWVVANYLDASEGPFSYPDRKVRVRDLDLVVDYSTLEGTLPQFGTRYIDLRLRQGDALVSFKGESTVSQVDTQCHSGRYCWWGNRGDSIDSKLTRELDLSTVDQATLEFWTWFRLEKDWDYAYVEVSSDGGDTWTILKGQYTTSQNPIGNNLGHGFTGASGGWVKERMDLSPYTGGKVLLRFEYVTDDAVYLDGFVIDDVAIPELGLVDGAEEDGGWHSEGFMRIENALPQRYIVRVIQEATDGSISVRDMDLDEMSQGQLLVQGFGSRLAHAVVVVSPITRGTHQPARYSLSVAPTDG